MRTELVHSITFGVRGNAADYQLYGWSGPENGFTWTIGTESAIGMPAFEARHGFFVEIAVKPTDNAAQSMTVTVNGLQVCSVGQVIAGGGQFAFQAGPLHWNDARTVVTIRHPNCILAGDRTLALAVYRIRLFRILGDWNAPPITQVAETVMGFESLGVNCELGFIQRQSGAEPLGLLRFAGSSPARVTDGIDADWAGVADMSNIEPFRNGGHWDVRHHLYHFDFHTFVPYDEATSEQIKEREAKRLGFLGRKMAADVRDAEKIFVVQRRETLSEAEILPLWLALRRRGPCCLLWLVPAEDSHPSGYVEKVRNGLLRGHLGSFTAFGAHHKPDHDSWLPVLRAAAEIVSRVDAT